jgi:DNA ligase-4
MPGFREKPDLFIEPEKSIVIQVKASEIVATEKYEFLLVMAKYFRG